MKLLKWLDGISSGIRSYLSDMLWYDYRVYPIVFWAIVLGLLHLFLTPLLFCHRSWNRKQRFSDQRQRESDSSDDDIPF